MKRAGRGKFRFDRVFPGVGRIHISSGTTNALEFRRSNSVLTKLFESSQIEVLKAFQHGAITIEQLVDADRAGRFRGADLLSDLALRKHLGSRPSERFHPWARVLRLGAGTTRRSRSFDSKESSERTRRSAISGTSGGDWNESRADRTHLRRAVSTFRTTLPGDVNHPFRRGVMKQIPIADERTGSEPEISVDRFLDLVSRVPRRAQRCYWCSRSPVCEPANTFSAHKTSLDALAHTVSVPGAKTGAMRAKVEVALELCSWIEAGISSPLRYGWMRRYFKRAAVEIGRQSSGCTIFGISWRRLEATKVLRLHTSAEAPTLISANDVLVCLLVPHHKMRY